MIIIYKLNNFKTQITGELNFIQQDGVTVDWFVYNTNGRWVYVDARAQLMLTGTRLVITETIRVGDWSVTIYTIWEKWRGNEFLF